MQEDYDDLYEKALKAQQNAYAPYSKFKVGAALKLFDPSETIYTGCNIENASFGATVCAERVAIWKCVAQRLTKDVKIEALCLVTNSEKGDVPCGMCLQVMAEFFSEETKVIIANESGILKTDLWTSYLPYAFHFQGKNKDHL